MSDLRLGGAIRLVRQRRGWTQGELGARCGVSDSTISRLERGHPDDLSVATVRRIAAAIDLRVDLIGRWRAGDLDRLLNRRHSALHEGFARWFGERFQAWVLAPEVSYSIFGERGIVDVLAWHPGRRALLVVELKTDIVDVNELVGKVDVKRRLAAQIVAGRGWQPVTVSAWVVVAPGRTNRRRIAVHRAMLRAAFPMDGRRIEGWLRDPAGAVAALSMWPDSRPGTTGTGLVPVRRVARRREASGRSI